jgi:glycosyltransferase involved in cell wall biosynthesis
VKILLIHQHFKEPQNGGAIRSFYLAEALVRNGHRVVVISASNRSSYHEKNLGGIEICYTPVPYDNSFSFYARALSFIRFLISAARIATRFRDFDMCYAISVPLTVGLTARWIKWKMKMPYIFEVGDLWPDAPVQMGFIRNYFLKTGLFALEKSIYMNAHSVVALSPPIQAAIESKVPGKKTKLIPNMADCDFYAPEEKSLDLEKRFGVDGKFVVSYIGATGVANGLDYFVECANSARKANLPIHFLLCGDGAMKGSIRSAVARLGLKNFTILDFLNREGVREIMNVTDAAFVCYKNVPILETGSPNKFFDGLASGKLIVINFGGWIRDEIESHQCGIAVDPMHPTDFVKKISPFISDPQLLKRYQHAARALGESKYSRKIISQAFAGLFADY